jgi:hypothetical protein
MDWRSRCSVWTPFNLLDAAEWLDKRSATDGRFDHRYRANIFHIFTDSARDEGGIFHHVSGAARELNPSLRQVVARPPRNPCAALPAVRTQTAADFDGLLPD